MLYLMEYRYYCGTERPDGGRYVGMTPRMFATYLRVTRNGYTY